MYPSEDALSVSSATQLPAWDTMLGNDPVSPVESHTCVAPVWGMMPWADPFPEL